MEGCGQGLQELLDQLEGPIKTYGSEMGVLQGCGCGERGDEDKPVSVRLRTLTIASKGRAEILAAEEALAKITRPSQEVEKECQWSEAQIDEQASKGQYLFVEKEKADVLAEQEAS